MKLLLMTLLLAGCGAAPTHYAVDDAGALRWEAYARPACSDVTISSRKGAKHAPECEFR